MPHVVAHIPVLFVGVPGRIALEISCQKETRIDFVDARITCYQGWRIGSGKSAVSTRIQQGILTRRLLPAGVLPEGTTRLAFDVVLPPGTPPWHAIDPAYAVVQLLVHVSLPWRFDDRARFNLPVRLPPGPPVAPVASVWRSESTRGDEPRIELGLASSRLAAGDTLVGSVAVYHMDDSKPREVAIQLVPAFLLHGRGRVRRYEVEGPGVTLALPAGSAGTSVPFAIQLPATMTSSFAALTQQLTWQVVARAGSLFGGRVKVSAPIEIIDAIGADEMSRHAMPPGLTNDRVAGVFANFARANGWHAIAEPVSTQGTHAAIAIARTEGDAELQLSCVHRGEAGTFLVARVEHASLGLGLDVTPSSALRHVFFKDVECGIPAWDRAHLVRARDEAQAVPVLREAVPTVMDAASLGTMVRWTDHAIAFERLVLAPTAADLDFARGMLWRVAIAIARAGALATPPPGCAVDVAAWRELARALDGHLALGDLSIAGTRGGAPVHLGLEFDADDQPIAIHATLGDPEQASELARAVTFGLARPAADASGAPEAVAELLARWPADFVDLHVADGTVAAAYPLPDGEPRAVDAARVRALVDALAGVLAALAPAGGPYR